MQSVTQFVLTIETGGERSEQIGKDYVTNTLGIGTVNDWCVLLACLPTSNQCDLLPNFS